MWPRSPFKRGSFLFQLLSAPHLLPHLRELPLPRAWASQGGLYPMIDNGEGIKVTSAHWGTAPLWGWLRCYFSCITMQFFHLLNLASSLSFLLVFWELLFSNKYSACQTPQHLLLENQPETSCPLGFCTGIFLQCLLTIILENPFDTLLCQSLYFPDLRTPSLCFAPLCWWSTSTSSFPRRDTRREQFF